MPIQKKIVNEEKREKPEGLTTEPGYCFYCGQVAIATTPDGWPEAKLNEHATLKCSCPEAKNFQDIGKQKERAKDNIIKLFGSEAKNPVTEITLDLMKNSIDEIADGNIGKISMDINDEIKAVLSKTAKGKIKVTRKENYTATLIG
ncbi:MAG: hypothetical protein FWG91_13825 [Lachnospiraceae bacterium]|nr:hypothetical protein [Lachnospiraceae bacterium]